MKNKKKLNKKITAIILCAALAVSMLCGKSDSYLRSRSVMLKGNGSQCSGEQIRASSGKDYILSAAHCHDLAIDGSIEITTEDGKHIQRRVIAEDPNSDLLLIEGVPSLRGLDIAPSEDRFQHVRTFTHGKGLKTYKTEGTLVEEQHLNIMLFQITDDIGRNKCSLPKQKILAIDVIFFQLEVCALSVNEIITTAMVVPGSSGGMVVNDNGDLIGVVSASADPFGALVRLKDIKKFLAGY